MAGLSKSRIIAHRQCPKRLWLQTYRPELAEVDSGTETRMLAGTQAGEVARQLYPSGILIGPNDLRQALADTARVLKESPHQPVFEATFQHAGVLVRADIMLPTSTGYRLVEVKSSTSVKPYHAEDAAIQAWVAEKAGALIERIEIAHIDKSFIYPGGGDYRGLFAYADITAEATALANEVPLWVEFARATLAGAEPDITPGMQCLTPFACPFSTYCSPPQEEVGFAPEILPWGSKLAARLREEGYVDLREVPESRLKNRVHQRVRRVCATGQFEVDPEAGTSLAVLPYPRYYLDFESVNFAVPIWPGTRPYGEPVTFQWSCHVEHEHGEIEHLSFLAADDGDPRRHFTETLLDALGDDGPVFVYSASFERSRMNELAALFADLAEDIALVVDRIVDLLPITRAHYCHADMHGSWSIKSVLPTIAPELAYDNLAVAGGDMAQVVTFNQKDRGRGRRT